MWENEGPPDEVELINLYVCLLLLEYTLFKIEKQDKHAERNRKRLKTLKIIPFT